MADGLFLPGNAGGVQAGKGHPGTGHPAGSFLVAAFMILLLYARTCGIVAGSKYYPVKCCLDDP